MYKKLILSTCLGLCFGTSTYAQINPNAASVKLTTVAKQKVQKGGINLTALLNNNANDLIVEYELNPSSTQNAAQVREYYKQQKQKIQANLKRTGGFELLREYTGLPISFHRIQNRDTLVQLLNDPNVKAVYPNRTMTVNASSNLNFIGQPNAQASGFLGENTTVVVIDTGLNYRHKDFGSCTAPGVPASTCRVSHTVEIAQDDRQLDSTGHGSNVSGIVAAVAPAAKLVGIDVFQKNWLGRELASDNDLTSAVNWAINNAKTLNIKSVNMSLGFGNQFNGYCTGALQIPFDNLRNAGVVPVVASGNEAYTGGISYPACLKGAVSVGAVYDSNIGQASTPVCTDKTTFSDKVTCFSNSSSLLSLLAPGANITAGGYTMSGTSMAAPHVAGALAVLGAALPDASIDDLISRLKNSGTLVTDSRNNIKTPRLNLEEALKGLNASQPPVVRPPVVTPPVVTPPVVKPPVLVPQPNCRTVYFFFLPITTCSA